MNSNIKEFSKEVQREKNTLENLNMTWIELPNHLFDIYMMNMKPLFLLIYVKANVFSFN